MAIMPGLLAMLLIGESLAAADQTNPYQSIVDRNAFGLREPPPPPEPAPPPPPPPVARPVIKLKGWTSLFSKPRALLQITEQGEKPQNFILSENERQGEIEVKSIDMQKNEVVLSVSGFVTNVTFAKKEDNAAPAAGRNLPVPGRPLPAAAAAAAAAASRGAPTVISRNSPRSAVTLLGGDPSGAAAAAAAQSEMTRPVPPASYNASSTAANRLRSLPTRSIRSRTAQPPGPAQPPMTTEQAEILIEAQKMTPEGQGLPFPPTRYSAPSPGNPAPPMPGLPSPR